MFQKQNLKFYLNHQISNGKDIRHSWVSIFLSEHEVTENEAKPDNFSENIKKTIK